MAGGVLDVSERHPGIKRAAVMNEWRRLCGLIRLVIPARRARRFTVRSAAWQSSPVPRAPRKIGPVDRSLAYSWTARAARGAIGIVACLPPLRTMARVW